MMLELKESFKTLFQAIPDAIKMFFWKNLYLNIMDEPQKITQTFTAGFMHCISNLQSRNRQPRFGVIRAFGPKS